MKKLAIGTILFAIALVTAGALYRAGFVQFNQPAASQFPVRGIDVSHHQGPVDWTSVAQAGIQFAYIKATEGRDFSDPQFPTNWADSHSAGVARGAYHFFTFCSPGKAQAEHFLRSVPPTSDARLPVADVEFVGNCKGYSSLDAVRTELAAFLEHIEAAWGVPPVIYTTPDAHRRVLAGGFVKYPLWLRSVLTQPRPDAFRGWVIWQYSETGSIPGIRGPVDLNVLSPSTTLAELSSPAA